jgi:hypothetical protein
MNMERILQAQAKLDERGYTIVSTVVVASTVAEALSNGEFVQGAHNLVNFELGCKEFDDIVELEFYRVTADNPQGEFAKAVAYFDNEELCDFYVVDSYNNEID